MSDKEGSSGGQNDPGVPSSPKQPLQQQEGSSRAHSQAGNAAPPLSQRPRARNGYIAHVVYPQSRVSQGNTTDKDHDDDKDDDKDDDGGITSSLDAVFAHLDRSRPVTVFGIVGRDQVAIQQFLQALLETEVTYPSPPTTRVAHVYAIPAPFANAVILHTVTTPYEELLAGASPSSYQAVLQNVEASYMHAMSFVTLASHVILAVHSQPSFDLNLLKQLRVLHHVAKSGLRAQVQVRLRAALGLPKNKSLARTSLSRYIPRLIFIGSPSLAAAEGRSATQDVHHQVLGILRSSGLLDDKHTPLISVTPGRPLGYLLDSNVTGGQADQQAQGFLSLINRVLSGGDDGMDLSNMWTPSQDAPLQKYDVIRSRMKQEARGIPASSGGGGGGGGGGKEGRNGAIPMPSAAQVQSSLSCIGQGISKYLGPKDRAYAPKINAFSHLDARFSENACNHALDLARKRYLEDTPPMFPEMVHERQVDKAVAELCSVGTGPYLERTVRKLAQECEDMWNDGRRMCSHLSLNGNPCVLAHHQVSDPLAAMGNDGVVSRRSGAPASRSSGVPRPHSSSHRYLSACNCGRTRRVREDPFDLISANYLPFIAPCCQAAPHHNFPTSSNPDPYGDPEQQPQQGEQEQDTAGEGGSPSKTSKHPDFPSWHICLVNKASHYDPSTGLQLEGFSDKARTLSTWDAFRPIVAGGGAGTVAAVAPKLTRHFADEILELQRQAAGKDHVDIDTPVIRCNVKGCSKEDRERYVGKFYVGFEYECPNGHRFIVPCDKPKHPVTSYFPPHDMPLYRSCCKSHQSDTNLAILQRIFIVTPDTIDIAVTVNPRVQFLDKPLHEDTAFERIAFSMGQDVALPRNAMLCLRLPNVYVKGFKPLRQTSIDIPYKATLQRGAIKVLPAS